MGMNENELNGINNGNNTVSNEAPVQSVVQETEEMPTSTQAVSTSPTPEGNINQDVTSTEGVQNPQMMNSNGTVSTEVGQEVKEPHVVKQKKQSNWVFIITVFAVVGIFVLLMPLLIRIFGY